MERFLWVLTTKLGSRIRENSAAQATKLWLVAWVAEFSRIRLPNLVGGRILTNSATQLGGRPNSHEFGYPTWWAAEFSRIRLPNLVIKTH